MKWDFFHVKGEAVGRASQAERTACAKPQAQQRRNWKFSVWLQPSDAGRAGKEMRLERSAGPKHKVYVFFFFFF